MWSQFHSSGVSWFKLTLALLCGGLLCGGLGGCRTLVTNNVADRAIPSNQRNWMPDMARLAFVEVAGRQVVIRNYRNCLYVTQSDYVPQFRDLAFSLDDIQGVDFIVVPFQKTPAIAHTMLSFALASGEYVCVSAEIRKEIGEIYSPMLGITNQFELYYAIADERDLIRLRTRHRDADVYIYPTTADPEAAQKLFLSVAQRVNELASRPEFYHTVTNNCTTNIAQHVNSLAPRKITLWDWRVMLPGFSAQYAYNLGLLDQSVPFSELEQLAWINELAERHYDAPDFSQQIRSQQRGRLASLENRTLR